MTTTMRKSKETIGNATTATYLTKVAVELLTSTDPADELVVDALGQIYDTQNNLITPDDAPISLFDEPIPLDGQVDQRIREVLDGMPDTRRQSIGATCLRYSVDAGTSGGVPFVSQITRIGDAGVSYYTLSRRLLPANR